MRGKGGDSMNQPALNIAPIDFCGEDSFEMQIGSTTYEVHTHFNTEGKQSVLEQFRTLILKEKLI